MTKEELNNVLANHMHWLRGDCDGWDQMMADLHGANLSVADLRGANLSEADLHGANLSVADLSGANLSGADLREADLSGAYLCGADLREANLYGADLREAHLREADLSGAYLCGANLYEADLREATNIPFIPTSCPDTGSFIGWKKDGTKMFIIKLLIPEDARRTSAAGRKCRCDKAQVLAIENIDGTKSGETKVFSGYDRNFSYCVGETVTPEKPFCEDRWQECSSGIHFFINRQEAVNYW